MIKEKYHELAEALLAKVRCRNLYEKFSTAAGGQNSQPNKRTEILNMYDEYNKLPLQVHKYLH